MIPANQLRAQLITGSQSHACPATRTYRLDGDELTFTVAGTNTVFRRADLPVADTQRLLLGFWRRTGNLPIGYVNMGILITPGGLGIYIGKSSPWDERSGGSSAAFFCRLVRYRVTGRHLQIGLPGPYGLHYDRVRGPFALLDGQFNVQHWREQPPATTVPAPTTNK